MFICYNSEAFQHERKVLIVAVTALSFKPYQNPIGPSILSWMHCTFGPSYPPVVFTCQSCIVWCLEP